MGQTQPFSRAVAKEAADACGMLKAPRTQAVPVLKGAAAADPEAWALARDAGIGASDIGVIMGLSSFASPYSLWWAKHLHWRLPMTEAMADGHAHESMIVGEFRERHPELYVAKPEVPLWRHPDYDWALCTPDYLAVQIGPPHVLLGPYGSAEEVRALRAEMPRQHILGAEIVPVELKWDAGKGWGASGTDEVPENYRLQVMWQAWIFGASGGWLVRRSPTGRDRYREYWIPVDMNDIMDCIAAGRSFVSSLDTGVSPDPDGSRATERALQDINAAVVPGTVATVPPALAEMWARARDDVRTAEAYKREMDNRLREVLGTAERGIHADTGSVFVERRISKRAGYEVAPALVDSLRRVSDGPRETGGGVPGADRAGGDDAPASPAGDEEAGAGGAGSPAGTAQPCGVDCGYPGDVIPASPELVALGDRLRQQLEGEDNGRQAQEH